VLAFLKSHPADFTIREDGVVRLNPGLARRVAGWRYRMSPGLTVSGKPSPEALPESPPSTGYQAKRQAAAVGFLLARLAAAFLGATFMPALRPSPSDFASSDRRAA
jgi:hypothetical protein